MSIPPPPAYPPSPWYQPPARSGRGWRVFTVVALALLLYFVFWLFPRAAQWHECGVPVSTALYLGASYGKPTVWECLAVYDGT